jgi:hypothetical protein
MNKIFHLNKTGQEPLYMLGNAQYFLSNTREECCEKFYEWNYYSCTGTKPDGSGDYYPDWNGSPATCKNDGNMPDYMLNPDNARWYLSSTLKECCERHVHYDLNNCMGSSGTLQLQVRMSGMWSTLQTLASKTVLVHRPLVVVSWRVVGSKLLVPRRRVVMRKCGIILTVSGATTRRKVY